MTGSNLYGTENACLLSDILPDIRLEARVMTICSESAMSEISLVPNQGY